MSQPLAQTNLARRRHQFRNITIFLIHAWTYGLDVPIPLDCFFLSKTKAGGKNYVPSFACRTGFSPGAVMNQMQSLCAFTFFFVSFGELDVLTVPYHFNFWGWKTACASSIKKWPKMRFHVLWFFRHWDIVSQWRCLCFSGLRMMGEGWNVPWKTRPSNCWNIPTRECDPLVKIGFFEQGKNPASSPKAKFGWIHVDGSRCFCWTY